MTVRAEDIALMVADAWSTMLALDVEPSVAASGGAPAIPEWTATVELHSGAARGQFSLRCGPELATVVAAALFDLDRDAVTERDIHDALGELANIVGGNVKSLSTGLTSLTIPVVGLGVDPVPSEPAEHELAFQCQGRRLVVTATVPTPAN